ncbi:hypothetical protein [Pelagicoccus sp. SDUM812002]|uniref:hypothetical protein n=1 Tax=Pelagicoccus sp. SDUM812002 TaxID=3041266 RepID=UPI00280C640B|nr:hypothetical protein [Pelagicoccus sp. SDUM812002]MDQ8186347.1 hypothetical protein [Pelagicoccus sp. SDUM812002]
MFPNQNNRVLAALAIALPFVFPHFSIAQDTEPDPWFTEEREAPEAGEENSDDEETVTLRKTRPAVIVKKLRKELDEVPDIHINRRISLLEEIVTTSKSSPEDQLTLAELRATLEGSLEAITAASSDSMPIEAGIDRLAPYAKYYRADSSLVTRLLNSDFTSRLKERVSSLGRLNMVSELSLIQTKINEAGLASIYGSQVKQSVATAAATRVARRWEELTRGQTTLPAETYLIGQLLKQNDLKLGLAIDLPEDADPSLSRSIERSIASRWGDNFRITDKNERGANPEFVLKIEAGSIQASHTTNEESKQSIIPGAIVEEPNPDFIALVERYEKAAAIYESELDSYDARYQYYIDSLDDTEHRQAQNSLAQAEQKLNNTPPPQGPGESPEYEAARSEFQTAKSIADSISAPVAIEPQKPYPHHLKILDELYLIPSTIIVSEEKTPYEYTVQELNYQFESKASLTLESPVDEQIEAKSVVSLNQNRKWTQNLGVDPRDPSTDGGTYSESEYSSALDVFGLEFGSYCNAELGKLLEAAKSSLLEQNESLELSQVLLLLALENLASPSSAPQLDEEDLSALAKLATETEITATQFRARCLAKLLSKTSFAHLADAEKIAQVL